ncbi:MAG: LPD38 domain-containing protein, partial [Bacillota bacterium]|nr:LPD38 domain-containing protein [Bacillota bacterium]
NLLKPLGYALETPYRIPLVNNILGEASKAVGGENAIADNAPMKQYSNSTGNKAIDTVGSYAGNMLGLLSTPITGLGTASNKNLLNGADDIANLVSEKVASKLPNSLSNSLTKSLINGGINGGLGNALNSTRFNLGSNDKSIPENIIQGLQDSGKSALEGAIGGGLMFGGANLLGKVGSKLLNSNSLSDALTTSKTNTSTPINNPLGKLKPVEEKPLVSNIKSGTYNLKNTALDKAYSNYDDAVRAIQNYWGNWKLDEPEIRLGAEELGINLDKILNDMQKAETNPSSIRDIAEKARLGQVAGVGADIKPLARTTKPLTSDLNSTGINTLPTLEKSNVEAPNPIKYNPSIGATDKTRLNIDFTTGDNKQKLGFIGNAKDKLENAYIHGVDTEYPFKKLDENLYMAAINSRKASGTVSHMLHDGLVDMKGDPIGESLKAIAKDIPQNEEPDFFNYVFQRHNIDRAREESVQVPRVDKQGFLVKDKNGNQVYDKQITKKSTSLDKETTAEQSQKAVALIEMKHPEYKALGDRLVNFTNQFMNEWGNKSGLVSSELWDQLQKTYKNYITASRDFTDLEQGSISGNGKKGFVNQTSGLKKVTGSDRNIVNPIVNLSNLVDSTVRRARYNEVGQLLHNYIQSNPDNPFASIISPEDVNSNVKNIVSVLRNGKQEYMQIHDKKLLESLQGIYKTNDLNGFEQGLKTVNNAFKSLITTKNPVFAVRNVVKDVPTAYINGSENNPIKFFGDLGSAAKDIIKNDPKFQKYKAIGGESANFFNPQNAHKTAEQLMERKLITDGNIITGSKPINPIKKKLTDVGNKVEVLNNLTESLPRYAEFKRVLEKTGDVQKALYAAGEVTTNFNKGGDVTKKLDLGVPYLSAGVQGLDKLVRQVKDKPLQTALKGATIVTAPTLLLNAVNKNNPDYQALDNRTKDNYYLIPKGDGTFIKIPRSREYGAVLGALTERILRASSGDTEAFKGFGTTLLDNFAPPNPLENNLAAPIINLTANKDFAGRTIVSQSMEGRKPQDQYDENTTEISKALGSKLNMSPKQIDYLVKSYTGVIGQLGIPATTKINYDSGNVLSKVANPITSQFVANPLKSSQYVTDFYDNKNSLTQDHNSFNFTSVPDKPQGMSDSQWSKLKPKSDTENLYNLYNSTSSAISGMRNEINTLNNSSSTADTQAKIKDLQKQVSDLASEANSLYKNPDKSKILEMTNRVKSIAKKYK